MTHNAIGNVQSKALDREAADRVLAGNFVLRDGISFAGTHLIADFWEASRLDDGQSRRGRFAWLRRPPARPFCAWICMCFPAQAASLAWPCWRRATSRSTPGRNAPMPRSTFSCAAAGASQGLRRHPWSFHSARRHARGAQARAYAVNTFKEQLYPDHGQYLAVASVFCACRTDYQDVLVFENPTFGKVLVLDGIVQLTERDSHVYHEMIAHVPMIAHGDARDVLIIGGGDGGTLREVIKHPINSVTLVELDPKVIEISQQYLPGISGGAFADPRLSVVLGDGARYIAEAGRRFDVIIVDSTDPIGPAQALFTDPFYAACRMALRETGVISLQSGCPFYQTTHVTRALSRLRDRFGAAGAYLAPVPTYANGLLALMIAELEDH